MTQYEEGYTLSESEKLVAVKHRNQMTEEGYAAREYQEFKKRLGLVLEITDGQAVDIIIGAVCAHFVEGTPLWMRIVGASRSGRTELLRTIISYGSDDDPEKSDVVEVEAITPASLRGGLREGGRLLDRIRGKLVVTKDLAALMTTRPEVKREIMGLTRSLKDGSLTSDFNTEEGHIHQEGEYDWIIATTPVFESERSMEDLLGARYVDLRWTSGERLKITRKALDNSPKLKELRVTLNEATRHFLDWIKHQQRTIPAPMPFDDDRDFIADLADLTAILRSPVDRDKYHDVKSMPMPEVGTDIAQSFVRISQGLSLMGIMNFKPYLWRLAKDCIPSVRRKVLAELLSASQEMTAYTIAQNLQLPKTTVTYRLEDMQLLQITEKTASTYTDKYGHEASFWILNPDIKSRLENFKAKASPAIYT